MRRYFAVALVALGLAAGIHGQTPVLLHVSASGVIVADGKARRIDVRDRLSGAALWSAPGPSHPQFAVSSANSAAVVDIVSSTVHVIDFAARAAVAVPVPIAPVAASFTAGRLCVLSRESDQLIAIESGRITSTVAVPRDSSFLAASGEELYVYSRAEGTLLRFDARTLKRTGSLAVGPFASDLEVSRGIGYLVFPAEATIAAIRLSDLTELERFRLGAVPIDLAISGDLLAVADPASRKLWRTERTRSLSSAFLHGFIRGLTGLGLKPPVSPDFPTAVDRVWAEDGLLLAFDSDSGTLYRIDQEPKLIARGIPSGSFAVSGRRLYLWDATSGRLRQIE